jgi:4a-hydroxytetrahydrobiopterin dehydratase
MLNESCSLDKQGCKPCEGGVPPLTQIEAKNLLQEIPDWTLKNDQLFRRIEFKNFSRTMAFVNAVAFLSTEENHHPDVTFGYNYCELVYTTHAINGLSLNDFICAKKVNQLLAIREW